MSLGFSYDPAVPGQGGIAPALRRYVHGPGMDEPLVWYEGAGLTTRVLPEQIISKTEETTLEL